MELFHTKELIFADTIQYPDIQIQAGKVTFICGASGSGKSSLLHLLNASISPSKGEIAYQGQDINTLDPIALRREVLLVAQAVYLFDGSIRDNFHRYYHYRDITPPTDDTIMHYLSLAALDLPLDSVCTVLSGGERQRIFLAIHLSLCPKVLMLDEPTSALDEESARRLMEHFVTHCKEHTLSLIIVSHDKALAKQYADNIITLGA